MSVTKKATGIEVVFTVSTGTAITNPLLTLTLPSEVTVISGTPSDGGSYSAGVWTMDTPTAAGASETLTLLVNVDDYSALPLDIVGTLTYDETLPDTADDVVTKTIPASIADKVLFPIRTLTDTGSPHSVLVGIDSAIKLDGTAGVVNLLLGDAAGWIYPDGSSYELKVNCINSTNAVTVDGGSDNIENDSGVSALTLALTIGESAIITSDGTIFHVSVSGAAI